jgi:RNA polymerase-binding transcription factor DksA
MPRQRESRHRQQLQTLRSRLQDDAAMVVDEARSPSGGQARGELSNAPFHLGDGGTEEFLQDMNAALAGNEQFLANEVDAALGRLDDGSYGRCESCGREIPEARLDAMPFARYCVECAEKLQAGLNVDINEGRPQSPSDTLAPEGAMQEDWTTERNPLNAAEGRHVAANDEHAAGEPGGGAATGGLAGANFGDGEPEISDLQDEAGSGNFDVEQGRDNPREAPRSGRAGGSVGGTPARKRAT